MVIIVFFEEYGIFKEGIFICFLFGYFVILDNIVVYFYV